MFEITFGPCPSSVEAVQLSTSEDRSIMMIQQCRKWRDQLEQTLQKSREHRDEKIKFRVKAHEHDFGTYYEVVGSCPDDDERAIEALFWLDSNAPENYELNNVE